jgi:hypothetical protein
VAPGESTARAGTRDLGQSRGLVRWGDRLGAANELTIPGVDGTVASGLAVGDWNLSCVTGRIISMTLVFHDGLIRTVSADDEATRSTTTLNTTYPGGGPPIPSARASRVTRSAGSPMNAGSPASAANSSPTPRAS